MHVIDQQLPKMLEFAPLNEDILAKEEAQAMNLLRKCEDYAHFHHFAPVKSLVYRGSPRLILVHQLVETYQVDLIVVGQSGLHALEKLMLGSVASYLVREASCDCLVVPFE
ncbi:universal stress protein [Enterococcus cecorum]